MQKNDDGLMHIIQHKVKNLFSRYFEGKQLAILGFGLEGRSTFKQVRKYFPEMHIYVCDRNAGLHDSLEDRSYFENSSWYLGNKCFDGLHGADIIMKSPGIPFKNLIGVDSERIKTQTALFLELFKTQVVGITGTKGKSTTAALLQHILKNSGKHSLLAGNIGTPCFDLIENVTPKTIIVFEMSSHQLENLSISPHISVLLNVFMEHLDHYTSFEAYRDAKMNIANWQQPGDYFLCNIKNKYVSEVMPQLALRSDLIELGSVSDDGSGVIIDGDDVVFSLPGKKMLISGVGTKRLLRGDHNLFNIAAAIAAAALLGINEKSIARQVADFPGLPHRLEYVGTIEGVKYYNDSIATIPEAAIEAVKAIPETATLIIGGYDRKLDYTGLIEFLATSAVQLILCYGKAGRRMYELTKDYQGFSQKTVKWFDSFDEAVRKACMNTPSGKTVMLSPAAASYDAFTDFKERGERFKSLVREFNA